MQEFHKLNFFGENSKRMASLRVFRKNDLLREFQNVDSLPEFQKNGVIKRILKESIHYVNSKRIYLFKKMQKNVFITRITKYGFIKRIRK